MQSFPWRITKYTIEAKPPSPLDRGNKKNKEKEAIATSLKQYVAKFPSQNKAAQSLKGTSAGTLSQILSGKWTLIYHNTTDTYDVSTPGALAADTRYWVYGYESGGVLAYERSTTAPDSRLQYKTGDKSRVYITTFVTNDSMVPVGYTQSGRVYTYELFVPSTTEGGTAGGPHGNLVLNDAMITGFATALNLDIAVPSYARQAVVKAGTVGFAASSRIVLYNRLSSSINGRYLDYTGTNDFMIQATIDQTANRGAPAQMYYTWSSTNLAMLLNLWVVSFVE